MKRFQNYSNNLRNLIAGFFLVVILGQTVAEIDDCVYEDTVDITDSKFVDGFYKYKEYSIPENLTGYYEFKQYNLSYREPVKRHLRGCICKIATCVQFCCGLDQTKTKYERKCEKTKVNLTEHINIQYESGALKKHLLKDEVVIQEHLPCYYVEQCTNFTLFENGIINCTDDKEYYVKNQYCIDAGKNVTNEGYNDLVALICYKNEIDLEYDVSYAVLSCLYESFSVICCVLTIAVYATIRELKNLHGICLINYLFALSMMFMSHIYTNIGNMLDLDISEFRCAVDAYGSYFFVFAVFCWLSAISFDLWYSFRSANAGVSRSTKAKRFFIYFLIAWLLPVALTGLVYGLQNSEIADKLKPGFEHPNCWFIDEEWPKMYYLYGPILIFLIFNIAVFFLTASKIYKVQKELNNFEISNRHLNNKKNEFGMYLRLFIVMGLPWIFEILSYFKTDFFLFKLTSIFLLLSGVIIFILFVLKRKVRKLVIKRFFVKRKDVPLQLNVREKYYSRGASVTHMSTVTDTEV